MKGSAGFAWTIARRRPFSVLVQVTNRCNMKCPFCDFWPNGAPLQELTTDDFRRFASELATVGTFLVSIEGGEPLVRPDLPEIVAAFARAGHLPVLYTNGWFVDEARAAALSDAGVHQVGVSIDFPDAARHDAMRRTPGAFDRAVAAVERLEATIGARRVHLMTVLMRQNQDDLEALLALSAGLGVRHQVTLLSDDGFRRGKLEEASRPDARAMAVLPALARRHRHLTSFSSYLDGMPRFLAGAELPRCRAGIQSFNVDHTGNVAACIETIDAPVGNVRDTPLAALLARLVERDTGNGCQKCWTLCRGMAQAMGEGGGARDWIDLTRM
ncbi:MAG: radical SAM protein [Pseudomonadota bacterium]|nr:radical SAM protein [Pseudomonadota bacterium]